MYNPFPTTALIHTNRTHPGASIGHNGTNQELTLKDTHETRRPD
ncbi:hypothetical protein [Boudabousia liubingyangii]|nr:hypothetical protein [Boudabousia liubingyangii]